MSRFKTMVSGFALLALTGCVTTTYNSYPQGKVKASDIKYSYTAKPVLSEPAGKTYQLQSNLEGVGSVPALEKRGVTRAEGGADVLLTVTAGPITHEPGSFGLGGSFQPALISRMPLAIEVKDGRGAMIVERKLTHEEILGIPGAPKFKTREEAKAAMTSITEVARSAADKKVRAGAPKTVRKNLDLVARDLFEPRKIAVTLPAVRKAGDVDLELPYAALAKAKGEAQVNEALAAYVASGTEHKKADGSEDVIGNYGVLCGAAAAKILAGDLGGAWQDTKQAWQVFPMGKEHRRIAQVLKQQETEAGVEIIPQADYDEMVKADAQLMKNQLQNLFGGGQK